MAEGHAAPALAAVAALRRYWSRDDAPLISLPIPAAPVTPVSLPPRLAEVPLPEWAADLAVDGGLLVPASHILPGPGPAWRRTDWWGAALWYLNGEAERAHECRHGPIHSYSFRLAGWDTRLWERAWVNRIALFLRRWVEAEGADDSRLGPMPTADVLLTHDVDAVRKTVRIRVKQGSFHAFNAARHLARGNAGRAARKAATAVRFLVSGGNYWCFDRIRRLEDDRGLRSHFNVYAGGGPARRWSRAALIDPAYTLDDQRLRAELRRLHQDGWTVGLHQSFNAWSDAVSMRQERERLEAALGAPVRVCRQHWLRFSWSCTWSAQEEAGLLLDTTLGFNDRPGFRNGAALRFRPSLDASTAPGGLESLPLVLMDSHLYDYYDFTEEERARQIARWIGEVREVRGTACVLWHQQVFDADYGWEGGFRHLLDVLGS